MMHELRDENGVIRLKLGTLDELDIVYSVSKGSLSRALQKWMDDFNANPESFTIYKDGESKEYGVAAAEALIDYVNQVDGKIDVLIKGDVNVAK